MKLLSLLVVILCSCSNPLSSSSQTGTDTCSLRINFQKRSGDFYYDMASIHQSTSEPTYTASGNIIATVNYCQVINITVAKNTSLYTTLDRRDSQGKLVGQTSKKIYIVSDTTWFL